MVEQVVIICQAYFYTFLYTGIRLFFLFFFLNLSWIGKFRTTNYSTNSQSVNVNLVKSLAINLPHTLRCNLQYTIIVFKTLAIVYIRTSLQYTVILTTWLSNLTALSVHNDTRTCHSDGTDMFIVTDICFERWTKDFEQETGCCR